MSRGQIGDVAWSSLVRRLWSGELPRAPGLGRRGVAPGLAWPGSWPGLGWPAVAGPRPSLAAHLVSHFERTGISCQSAGATLPWLRRQTAELWPPEAHAGGCAVFCGTINSFGNFRPAERGKQAAVFVMPVICRDARDFRYRRDAAGKRHCPAWAAGTLSSLPVGVVATQNLKMKAEYGPCIRSSLLVRVEQGHQHSQGIDGHEAADHRAQEPGNSRYCGSHRSRHDQPS